MGREKDNKLALEEELIGLVQGHTLLYDVSNSQYKNENCKRKKWTEFADILGIDDDGNNSPANQCKALWQSLRNQYTAHLRKLRLPPTGNGKKTIPYFRHAEALQFLADVVEPRKKGNFKTTADEEDEVSEEDKQGQDDPLQECEFDERETEVSSGFSSSGNDEKRIIRNKSKKLRMEEFEQRRVLANDTTTGTGALLAMDQFSQFFLSLAPKLRGIHDVSPIKASELQLRIHQLIHKYELDLLNH